MIGTLLERLFVQVGADLSGLDDAIEESDDRIDNFSRRAQGNFSAMGQRFQRVGEGMQAAGKKMSLAITAPLVAFATLSAKAAIDAEEMNSAFDVVFGDMSASVRQWAEETGNAMGRSTQEIQRGALAFQELFGQAADPQQAVELSQQFAVLTQDLASFKNLSNEVAQQKLFAGLVGEAEPLRAVGVFLNAAVVEAKAVELGLEQVNGKFTDQQLILARAAVISESLSAAQGDVLRTSDSAANRIRTSQAAFEELSVTVGTTLIPALTPLVSALTSVLESFNTLSPEMQTFIIGAGAVAAVVGPVVGVIGTLITGITGLVAALGGLPVIISVVGAALNTLFLSPLGLVVLAIAAVVAAFVYWDEIKAVLISVGQAISDWYTKNVKPTVDKVISVLQPFIDFFRDYFGAQIEGVINVVGALLEGDFAGAWEAAKEAAFKMLQALANLMGEVGPVVINALKGIYEGAKQWLQDRLRAVLDWVIGKVEDVGDAFFNLYDAVVGNSYVPDMVERIGEEMAKLQALMVEPAERATGAVDKAFAALADRTENLLTRLFPAVAQIRAITEDLATLDEALAAGQISLETYQQGRGILLNERLQARRDANGPAPVSVNQGPLDPLADVDLDGLLNELIELPPIASKAQIAMEEFGFAMGSSINDALLGVLEGRDFFDSLKRSFSVTMTEIITSSLQDISNVVFGKGGIGGIFDSFFRGILSGGARAVGGPVLPGRAYDVGAGEKFVPSSHGRILSRSDAMAAMGGGRQGLDISVTPSPLFDVEVRRVANDEAAAAVKGYDTVVGSRVQTNLRRK